MWKKALISVYVLTLTSLLASCQGQTNSDIVCATQTSCGQCISASAECAWCNDEEVVADTRCRLASSWSADHQCKNVTNPKGYSAVLKNTSLSDNVQVSPQQFKISLRPGETVEFTASVRPAANVPIDLYYLMDLSKSMEDDLNNLKTLSKELAEGLLQKTKDVNLGFGTFVDKTVLPYVSDAHLRDTKSYRRAFSFINSLPLTSESRLFVEKVQNESISINLDNPEGGMDALMQVVVCGDKIGWRNNARRIVILATDYDFHIAGDGRLGGAVLPHDGNCYLDDSGTGGRYREDVARRLDYPSIGQIKEKLIAHHIIPVFAVEEKYIGLYNELKAQLTGAFTGILASDSENVVSLIQGIYDEIVSSVTPVIPTHQGISIGVRTQCTVNSTDGPEATECHDVPLGRELTFSFNITADSCEALQKIKSGLTIQFVGFGEIKLDITPICECECESQPVIATQCEGGALVCGQCQCLQGRSGKQCQCVEAEAEDKCLPQNATADTPVCHGHGQCLCSSCECTKNFFGGLCECSKQACSRDNNGEICGGSKRGECICIGNDLTKCECKHGYTGANCSCPQSLDTCKQQPSDLVVCNGHGLCSCGECVCDEGYLGALCDVRVCSGEEDCGASSDICNSIENCAECYGFKTGPYARNCSVACPPLVAESEIPQKEIYTTYCTGAASDCAFSFAVLNYENHTVYGITVSTEMGCPGSMSVLVLVLGLALGLAALILGLLIVWKLVTWYMDHREYKQFKMEQAKTMWSKSENPLYEQPVKRTVNPAYGGGQFHRK